MIYIYHIRFSTKNDNILCAQRDFFSTLMGNTMTCLRIQLFMFFFSGSCFFFPKPSFDFHVFQTPDAVFIFPVFNFPRFCHFSDDGRRVSRTGKKIKRRPVFYTQRGIR